MLEKPFNRDLYFSRTAKLVLLILSTTNLFLRLLQIMLLLQFFLPEMFKLY